MSKSAEVKTAGALLPVLCRRLMMFYLLSKKTTKDQGTTGSVMGMNSPLVKINMQMIGYTVMMNILVFLVEVFFIHRFIISID